MILINNNRYENKKITIIILMYNFKSNNNKVIIPRIRSYNYYFINN